MCVPVGITISAVGTNICTIITGIKKYYKSISQKVNYKEKEEKAR